MAIAAGSLVMRVGFAKRGAPPAAGADFGTPLGEFVRQFEVFAAIRHLRGSEPVVQSRLEGRQPIVVTVRASPDTRSVTEEWRVEIDHDCDCRHLAITAVTPHDDRTGIDFLCVYGGAVG